MKKFIVTIYRMEYDEKFEFITFKEAHEFAMERWFWGALGFYITDEEGTIVELRA